MHIKGTPIRNFTRSSNNKQKINNIRITALERKAAENNGMGGGWGRGLNIYYRLNIPMSVV